MPERGEAVESFPIQRRGTVDYMRVAGRRSVVHGLVEIDVTDARRSIETREANIGERLSFTAFLVYCLAQAIDEHPHVNAYRDWWGRIVRFDDVDVNVLIEKPIAGNRLGVPTSSGRRTGDLCSPSTRRFEGHSRTQRLGSRPRGRRY